MPRWAAPAADSDGAETQSTFSGLMSRWTMRSEGADRREELAHDRHRLGLGELRAQRSGP